MSLGKSNETAMSTWRILFCVVCEEKVMQRETLQKSCERSQWRWRRDGGKEKERLSIVRFINVINVTRLVEDWVGTSLKKNRFYY